MDSSESQPEREQQERLEREPRPKEGLPAGLESAGRDEGLEHSPEVQPTGERADRRHSVPGTMIPGGPRPAASGEEWERIQDAAEDATRQSSPPPERTQDRGQD
jgi:hypothetical protein